MPRRAARAARIHTRLKQIDTHVMQRHEDVMSCGEQVMHDARFVMLSPTRLKPSHPRHMHTDTRRKQRRHTRPHEPTRFKRQRARFSPDTHALKHRVSVLFHDGAPRLRRATPIVRRRTRLESQPTRIKRGRPTRPISLSDLAQSIPARCPTSRNDSRTDSHVARGAPEVNVRDCAPIHA